MHKHYAAEKGYWALTPDGKCVTFRYKFYNKRQNKQKENVLMGLIHSKELIEVFPGFFRETEKTTHTFQKE
ncbi:hypothetical protein BKI52_00555 [marine bacterium AO1-C]|nr:hypothetical protein BKI52_00555 [marine bacterium AO1-C]